MDGKNLGDGRIAMSENAMETRIVDSTPETRGVMTTLVLPEDIHNREDQDAALRVQDAFGVMADQAILATPDATKPVDRSTPTPLSAPPLVSVIIPTCLEATTIQRCLSDLARNEGPLEVIVSDGGSSHETVERACAFPGVRVTHAARGRAAQLNHGAALARGDIFWFLHADSRPPPHAVQVIRSTLADRSVTAGAFRFASDSPRWPYRLIELGVRIRSEWLKVPYGDQGFFLRRSTFEALGGFPSVPIMEDLYFLRELRRRGKITVVKVPLPTSARRWERLGVLRTTWRNWKLVLSDWLGVSPTRLVRIWEGSKENGRDLGHSGLKADRRAR